MSGVDDETAAAPATPLGGLRARREKARQSLFVDLQVPRLDPPVFVRFGPIDQGVIDEALDRMTKSKDKKNRGVIANASVLVQACRGVFELGEDGKPTSVVPDQEEWPRFDEALAAELEVPAGRATEVVRGLYLTDGDIAQTAGKVLEWNGFAADLLEEQFEGN